MDGHLGKGQSFWKKKSFTTTLQIFKKNIYLPFNFYLIGIFIVRCKEKCVLFFKKCLTLDNGMMY